jgi:pre-mRNA-splicing factor SYF2
LPANWDRKQERILNEEELEKKKREAEEQGLSYDRLRILEWGADECEQYDKQKKRKHNPDSGFTNYEDATTRQYERLIKNLEPDMENYEKLKEELGEDFYANKQTLTYGTHKPSQIAIDKLTNELEKQ